MILLKSGLIILLLKVVQGELHIIFNGKDISGLTNSIKIIEGEDLLFECTSSYPNTTYIWTKDGTDSSFSQKKEIQQIQVVDEGMYNCQAVSFDEKVIAEIVENRQVIVEVLYPPSYPTVEPVYLKGPYYALHGEYITLKCQSDANPEPHYQWRRDNINGPVLTRNATYNMMVASYIIDYYCIIQNRMVPTLGEPKTTSLTRRLQIRVYVKAYIYEIEGGTYRNVNEGESITVSCTAYGRPPPIIWWTKENDESFYLESDVLSQASVSTDFAGKYFCNVENNVTASDQTRIRTYSKQEVHINVHAKSIDKVTTENGINEITTKDGLNIDNCRNAASNQTNARKDEPKNIALFVLIGIGWLGFVMSGLLHIIICTKNRNKRASKAAGNQSAVNTNNNESLTAMHSYMSNVRIPESEYSPVYDQISAQSSAQCLSDGSSSSLHSNLTTISTVPSYASIQQNSSASYLHPQES